LAQLIKRLATPGLDKSTLSPFFHPLTIRSNLFLDFWCPGFFSFDIMTKGLVRMSKMFFEVMEFYVVIDIITYVATKFIFLLEIHSYFVSDPRCNPWRVFIHWNGDLESVWWICQADSGCSSSRNTCQRIMQVRDSFPSKVQKCELLFYLNEFKF